MLFFLSSYSFDPPPPPFLLLFLPLQSRYSTALYFVFTGLCSVGFGNVAPNTDNEMIFAIVMMLSGCKWTTDRSSCHG